MVDLNYAALLKKAYTAAQNKEWLEALYICEEILPKGKNDPNLLVLMANIAKNRQQDEQAVQYLKRCVSLLPRVLDFHIQLAFQYTRMGRFREAVRQFERASRLQPNHQAVIAGLADAHERAGEPARASALLDPIVHSGTETAFMALVWAKLALGRGDAGEARRILTRHIPSPTYPTGFFLTLGQACERLGNLQEAFDAYCSAKHGGTTTRFDLENHIERVRALITTFTTSTLSRLPKPAHNTSLPIVIAARPRSGTTLVEKILDSHPEVTGVGELPHIPRLSDNIGLRIDSSLPYPSCISDLEQSDVDTLSREYLNHLRKLAPHAARTVDKNLDNYIHLGLISILWPQARVIHVRRNAIDNCWSCFVADLTYGWAADLRLLGITQSLYERLMQHWHESLQLPILDVDYESLVEDQEGWSRRIIEFCGLEWDDRCLRFYEESARKKDSIAAPTLSYNQVRRPIYKSSVGRAKKFEPFLGPLFDGLEEGRRIAESLTSQ